MKLMTVEIVIVNWNSGKQLKECLRSIDKADKSHCFLNSIVIVDNASFDRSADSLNFSLPIQVIKNDDNLGFGRACNIGAQNSQSDFILFLNPDMLVYEDTFFNLFKYIEHNDNEDIGIYGIQLQDENKKVQKTCARFPTVWNFVVRSLGLNKVNNRLFKSYTMYEWDHLSSKEVNQVMGAFFMVKNDLFKKLNGFDERYFVYYEELDFSKRIADLGYKTKYVIESQAYHKGGGTSENVKAKRLFYNLQSRVIYTFKHFGIIKGCFVMFVTWLIEPLMRLSLIMVTKKYKEVPELFKGYALLHINSLTIIKAGLKK